MEVSSSELKTHLIGHSFDILVDQKEE